MIFRVIQYAWRRSYWHDEAALVLNITGKTAGELFRGPLEHGQAAPPLFVVTERAIYAAIGATEYTLRLLPLLAGIAALALFARLAWRVMPAAAAVVATALFALSDRLIWHSVEVKQYSGDVLAAVVMLTLLAQRHWSPTRRLATLCLFTTVAVWFSHAAVLCFAGASLALLPHFLRRGAKGLANYAAWHVLPVASFACLYALMARAARDPALHDYWREHFVNWANVWMLPVWLGRQTLRMANYPYEPLGAAILVLAILGLWALWLSPCREIALAVLATIGVTIIAAMAQAYPYGAYRLSLFMAPMLFLCAGMGTIVIQTRLRGVLRTAAWGAVIALIGYGLAVGSFHTIRPRVRHHIRPVVEQVRAHRSPADAIYLIGDPTPHEFFSYWRGPRDGIVAGQPQEEALPARFWVVVTYPPDKPRHLQAVLERFANTATQRQRHDDAGATAVLFDRRENR